MFGNVFNKQHRSVRKVVAVVITTAAVTAMVGSTAMQSANATEARRVPMYSKVVVNGSQGMHRSATNAANYTRRKWGCSRAKHSPCVYEIEGFSRSHVRGSDHAKGKAIDAMVSPLGRYPSRNQKLMGDDIAWYYLRNADALDVHYIIWNGQIWNGDLQYRFLGWRPYVHPTGKHGATYDHYDHVHISFRH